MEQPGVNRAILVGMLVGVVFGAFLFAPHVAKLQMAWAQTYDGGTTGATAVPVPVGLTIFASDENTIWLSVFDIHDDETLYGDYRVVSFEWQFRLASETAWTDIGNRSSNLLTYCQSSSLCRGSALRYQPYDAPVIAVTGLDADLYEFRARSIGTTSLPQADRPSEWSVVVSGTPGDFPNIWDEAVNYYERPVSHYELHMHMAVPTSDTHVVVEAHRAFFNHDGPREIRSGSSHEASSYEYVLITESELRTFGQITEADIVPNLQNYRDLDRGKPYTYLCSYTVCFAGLPADTSFYVGARALNERGHVSQWSLAWINGESSVLQFKTQKGSAFTPTPTPTLDPGDVELEDTDYEIDTPSASVNNLDSQYVAGDEANSTLTLDFTLVSPPAAVHSPESLLEFKVGASANAGDAGGQSGFLTTCGRATTCRVTYTTERDSRGQVLSDAYVLWFWAEAHWEDTEETLKLTHAPVDRTFSTAIALRNPLMVGKDPRKDATAHYLGSPNATYRTQGGRIAVKVDGLVLPESRVADHYQTQVNDSVELVTHEASSGGAQYVVSYPNEANGRGYVSVRTRARVCADDTERTVTVDDGDPNTGDAYTVQPYHCIYSFWDVPWTPPIPVVDATPQPAGATLMGINDPNPRVEGAVEEILNTVMPIEEGRERPEMDNWLVLFCLILALGVAVGFGAVGGVTADLFVGVASGAFGFVLVFGLLGTMLFGVENGMAFVVCVIPAITGLVLVKVRYF